MGVIKETVEGAAVTIEKMRIIRAWASVSLARTILVMLLAGIALLAAQYAYVENLLTEAKKNGENRTREATELGKELQYKVALDSITMCQDSVKEKPELHGWYCKHAVMQYKQASANWPQDRVKEVIGRLAYGAMKNDVSHYLRSVELDRLLHGPRSKEEELLNLVLSKMVIGLWAFIVAFVLAGAYFALWILPNRKLGSPDA